jgi:hyperosmotically inducible periplasmic protein
MPHTWRTAFALAAVLASSTIVPVGAQAQTGHTGNSSSAAAHHNARSDDAIQDRIEHRLATDSDVRRYDIAVSVNDGVVSLNGAVATDAQKAQAAQLAKVSGVVRVDNNLKVDGDVDRTLTERAKSGLTKTGEAITDAWITAKVKWFYVGEDSLKGSDITVETNNRVVTLKGTVGTAAAKTRAFELAKETDGVSRVDDHLVVKADPAKIKATY